jgi:hypothetical protein
MRPRFYSLNEYLRETYGEKMYKLALNGGMTCPNRDGLIDTRGCIFCSEGGSGDFACNNIDDAKLKVSGKYSGDAFIAYFQSYTNTYAPVDYLRKLFTPYIMREDVRILSVATRPDCLGDECIELLSELNRIKPVWVELGLQTIHPKTAEYIRRGYTLDVFDTAMKKLKDAGIYTVVHMIVGLPGEDDAQILATAKYIAALGADGIKIALLHVLENTDLAQHYRQNEFTLPTLDEYLHILGNIIEVLPPNMAIHRLTGDAPKKLLIAPLWSADKKHVYNSITKYFKETDIIQGRLYHEH